MSSHVLDIDYDADGQELWVRFAPTVKHPGGRVAVYSGVPQDVADDVQRAPSIGSAIRQTIRDQYPFRYA